MTAPWELPGGQAFAEEIRDRLERGDHLTVSLPINLDGASLVDHMRRSVGAFAHHVVAIGETDSASSEPLRVVLADLGIPVSPGLIPTADELVASREASGLVIWLSGLDDLRSTEQGRWGDLLRVVSSATRRLGPDMFPPRFVALAHGFVHEVEPDAAGWSHMVWWGRMRRLDIAMYVHRAAPVTAPSRRSSIVELAGFDLALAERLLAEPSMELGSVGAVLRDERETRGYDLGLAGREAPSSHEGPGALAAPWAIGAVDRFDDGGRPFWHSCLFTDEPGLITLRRRLWRAQVNELLPRLEEWRMELVEAAKREQFIAGGVALENLDFADLHNHLRKGQQSKRRGELADFAGWLRGARNRIAHLDIVDAAERARGERLAERCLA